MSKRDAGRGERQEGDSTEWPRERMGNNRVRKEKGRKIGVKG